MTDYVLAWSYQKAAARTINKNLTTEEKINHALFGMASEVGELTGIYQKAYQGAEIDEIHCKKELGDLLWFIAEYCTAMGWNLTDVMETNIEKLKERYPDGFEIERSLHRKEGDI